MAQMITKFQNPNLSEENKYDLPLVEPCITMNVYCGRSMDEVFIRVLAPFLSDLSDLDKQGEMWVMRYRRCGEHLKLRIYADSKHTLDLRARLSLLLSSMLSDVIHRESETVQKLTGKADPPIDEEDKVSSDYPAGRVLWTHYNRSHVTFGGEPYLSDDEYISSFTTCLVTGCRRVIDCFAYPQKSIVKHADRILLLLEIVDVGLRAAHLNMNNKIYLEYHRDWLIRFVLLKSGHNPIKHDSVITRFNQQIKSQESIWQALFAKAKSSAEERQVLSSGIEKLMQVVHAMASRGSRQIDPYALCPEQSVLFKLLHSIANQIGLPILDEASVYHSLVIQCDFAVKALI
jgi:uncharacterized protein (UPF0332 family)